MNTPTGAIVSNSRETFAVTDGLNRTLEVRRINALDRLRLLKAAGPGLSQNDAWLNLAALAFSVVAIDSVPRVTPTNEHHIETAVAELGDAGMEAVAEALNEHSGASLLFDGLPEGNAAGTPN